VGAAQMGWEVPCIARPSRARRGPSQGILASVPEDLVREAVDEGSVLKEDGEEPGGGWVEDLNGLLGFNKGFRGRYTDVDHEE
jgi:hypothetical protein